LRLSKGERGAFSKLLSVELLSASIRLRLGAMFLPVKNAARGPKQANSPERLRFNAVRKKHNQCLSFCFMG